MFTAIWVWWNALKIVVLDTGSKIILVIIKLWLTVEVLALCSFDCHLFFFVFANAACGIIYTALCYSTSQIYVEMSTDF